MKQLIFSLLVILAGCLPVSAQIMASRGIYFGPGSLLTVQDGFGAPADSCNGWTLYKDENNTTGSPLWVCLNGHMAPASSVNASTYLSLAGGTLSGNLTLKDGSLAASQAWVLAQIAAGGGSGVPGTPDPGTNIGTVNRTGIMTNGSIPFKTCYVGGSVCSGGVGYNPTASTPQRSAGLATPNAATGTANAVASHTLTTQYAKVSTCYHLVNGAVVLSSFTSCFTDVLWTTTNGGLGTDSTSTNWYRDFWMKAAFPSGTTHFEFDTYAFNDGWDWMWGTQCNATKKLIQYDNQGNGWVDTAIPCAQLLDGNWHHIQQTFHRDLAGQLHCAGNTAPCEWWDSITIDNVVYVISKSLPATTTTWTSSGGQIQLDTEPTTASSGTPAVATVYIDTDIVTAGSAPDAGGTDPGGDGGGGGAGTGELDSFNFDSGTLANSCSSPVGTSSFSTANAHSAPNSMSFPTGNNYCKDTLAASTSTLYSRQYITIASYGSNSNSFLRLYNGTNEFISFFFSANNGNPTYFLVSTSATVGMSSSGFAPGTTHLVETYTKISSTAGQIICKIDGTTVYTSATNLNTGSGVIDTVWYGQIGNTAPVGWGTTYMDNVDFSAVGWIGPI